MHSTCTVLARSAIASYLSLATTAKSARTQCTVKAQCNAAQCNAAQCAAAPWTHDPSAPL
eukprot:2833909-Amphidinium_carterae.1